jgi:hypothetical protein
MQSRSVRKAGYALRGGQGSGTDYRKDAETAIVDRKPAARTAAG